MCAHLLCIGTMGLMDPTPRGILLPRAGGMTSLLPLFVPLLAAAIPLVISPCGPPCGAPWVTFLTMSSVLMGPGGDDRMNGWLNNCWVIYRRGEG